MCDSCQVSVIVAIDFYSINDLHGKFCDTNAQPGVDELATYLETRRDYDDNVVILSTGDMWQGTAESGLTYGEIMTEWMNLVGFVSMSIGNHEYDWGEEYIRKNLEISDFPFLAINIYNVQTNERVDYATPSVMIERGGVQIGIIGAIGDCYSSISSDFSANVYFKVGEELSDLVKNESEKLKKEGADIVVFAVHDGIDNYDLSLSNGYVDLVLEGHNHIEYIYEDIYGVVHFQTTGENSGLSHAELLYNSVTGKVELSEAEIVGSNVYSRLEDDPETEALEAKYDEIIKKAYELLGSTDRLISSGEIADLVAKLYFDAGVERWGADYNITLGGGYIRPRSPYEIPAGDIRYSDLFALLPFNNDIVLCSISGRDLLSRFINTSNANYHCYYTVDPSEIDAGTTYYVIVDTYSSTYSYNNLTEVARYDNVTYARDLFADFVRNGGFNGSDTPDEPTDPDTPTTDGKLDPSAYDLLSIEKALEIGSSLELNQQTSEFYYVMGTVTSVANTKYGNIYISDDNGNSIYLYGCYDLDGNRYDAMTAPPTAGDVIIVYAPIKNYYNQNNGTIIIELVNSVFIGIV